jgi:hypothetical protein
MKPLFLVIGLVFAFHELSAQADLARARAVAAGMENAAAWNDAMIAAKTAAQRRAFIKLWGEDALYAVNDREWLKRAKLVTQLQEWRSRNSAESNLLATVIKANPADSNSVARAKQLGIYIPNQDALIKKTKDEMKAIEAKYKLKQLQQQPKPAK